MHISIVSRPGSKAVTKIVKSTKLTRYSSKCDIIVNYGLAGEKFQAFKTKHPGYYKKPMLNASIGYSKYKVVKIASEIGIKTPKTSLTLPTGAKKESFLTKRLHSQGGVGIAIAKSTGTISGKYYQEFIKNRKYELRVHGFLWEEMENWKIQKRFGKEGEIAWNFHNGGRFQSIQNTSAKIFSEAKEITEKILKRLNMAFGAADFVVTDKNELLFLEINSAPGFTDFSEKIYIDAFANLTKMSKQDILKFCK